MTRLLPASLLGRLGLLGLLLVAGPLQAKDQRLASRAYDAGEVVRIDGRAGVQAAIAFADDEQIENVAIGDSASWQVTPNKRATMLFIKPLSARARTNLTVVTDRRSYYFDLVASPTAQPLYVLRFTYPGEAGKARASTAARGAPAGSAALTPEEQALALADAADSPATPAAAEPAKDPAVDPARLNFAWQPKGKRKLLPERIYDDGSSTYLSWPAGTTVPAILIQDARGAEGAVNFAVRDDVVVIEGVPPLLVLRSGRDAALLENRGPASRRPAAAAREPVRQKAAPAPSPVVAPGPAQAPAAAAAVVAALAAGGSSGQTQPSPTPSQDN